MRFFFKKKSVLACINGIFKSGFGVLWISWCFMSESLVTAVGKSSVNLCGAAGLLFSPCAALRRSLVATTGVWRRSRACYGNRMGKWTGNRACPKTDHFWNLGKIMMNWWTHNPQWRRMKQTMQDMIFDSPNACVVCNLNELLDFRGFPKYSDKPKIPKWSLPTCIALRMLPGSLKYRRPQRPLCLDLLNNRAHALARTSEASNEPVT